MRVIIDTNIVIDYFQKRDNFYNDANKIINLIKNDKFIPYITVKSLTDIYYIVNHSAHSNLLTKKIIKELLILLTALDSTENDALMALDSELKDYEDALMEATAFNNNIDYIVTRNPKDFKNSIVKVIEPKELIKMFE